MQKPGKRLLKKPISRVWNQILDTIFPKSCLGCGQEGVWLCSRCQKNLHFNKHNYCLGCWKKTDFSEFCEACRSSFFLDGVWIAGDYNNPLLSNLIKNLKYSFVKEIKNNLGQFVSSYLRNYLQQISISSSNISGGITWRDVEMIKNAPAILYRLDQSIVIPVPLSRSRKRWRGFNQAHEIAEQVADNFRLRLENDLRRVKHKKPQAKLGRARRQTNIKNCFHWQGNSLKNKNIILVDDVTTTGATLNECARVLKENSAESVWGLVVAHG